MKKYTKTNEELLEFRQENTEKYLERRNFVTERYIDLCRILEGETESFKIDTPFGDIIFYPKNQE